MTTVVVRKDETELREALRRVKAEGERVLLEQEGEPVGALVSMEDLKALEQLEDLLDAQDYRAALEEWEKDGKKTVPLEALLREYDVESPQE